MLRPVNERYVGDLYLGSRDEVAFIAAANPTEHAAGGWDLPPSMANRWLRLTWTVDLAKWSRYMAARGAGSVAMRSEVVSFLRARPDLLINVPASESEASKSWPSPRSWEALCRVGSEVQAGSSLGQATLADIAVGCVGAGAATEWLAFRQALDLPDPEVALANPEAFMPPERGDRLYAALTAIAASVAAKTSIPRWNAAWRCFERVPPEGKAVVILAGRMLAPVQKGKWASLPASSPLLREILPTLVAVGNR
jgi:hypothetical protein